MFAADSGAPVWTSMASGGDELRVHMNEPQRDNSKRLSGGEISLPDFTYGIQRPTPLDPLAKKETW